MIKKLRFKLIAASMLSLFVVLAAIMSAINVISYQNIVEKADTTLSILQENGGVFPKKEEGGYDAGGQKKPAFSKAPYQSHFFSVLMSGQGEVLSADMGKEETVDSQTAGEYARLAWGKRSDSGFIGDYRYRRYQQGEDVRILFLDCQQSLSTFRTFLMTSCGISVLGLLAVFGLIVVLSGRIIRPVSESYEKQKRFITDAGHELKTPLTIIDADAEVMRMEGGDSEWLRDIQAQTKRLATLTNDLIQLSRMEETGRQVPMIEFPFSDLAGEVAQSFQSLAKAQDKAFFVDIQPMISLRGDEKSLRQLLSILLDNAVKYTDRGGWMSLSLSAQGKGVQIAVGNQTTAPLPENLDDLFGRFYRADQSRNSQTGGYGLGLSIARAIVSAHKGKIQAQTEDGHSLWISVWLPG